MRELEEIYETLKEDFAARSGIRLSDGCDMAVRLWAAAAQIQALEIQGEWVLRQSFPQTAEGAYLDRHAAVRGLTRMSASRALGTIRFSIKRELSGALTVAAGTVCMSPSGARFETLEDAVIQEGTLYADAAAQAVEGGSGGNMPAGTVTLLTACPVAVTGCTNVTAFSGGNDAESDEALRERVLESYRRLPNGANSAWYEATAMSHTGVAAARAVGRARGIGTVDVYVTTESGETDEELLEAVGADLQSKREIAVDVAVKAPAKQAVDVCVEIKAKGDFEQVRQAVEKSIIGFFSGRLLGRSVRLAELGNRIYDIEGVENYHILSPEEDVAGDDTVLPVLGELSVEELEE